MTIYNDQLLYALIKKYETTPLCEILYRLEKAENEIERQHQGEPMGSLGTMLKTPEDWKKAWEKERAAGFRLDATNRKLEAEVTMLKHREADAKSRYASAMEVASSREQAMLAERAVSKRLGAEIEKMRATIEAQAEGFKFEHDRAVRAESRVVTLQTELDKAQGRAGAAEDEVTAAHAVCGKAGAPADINLLGRIGWLADQCDKAKALASRFATEIESLKDSWAQTRGARDLLREEVDHAHLVLTAFEGPSTMNLADRIRLLGERRGQVCQANETLKRQLEADKNNDGWKLALESAKAQLAQAQAASEALKRQLAQVIEARDIHAGNAGDLQTELQAVRGANRELQAEVEHLRRSCNALEADRNRLRDQEDKHAPSCLACQNNATACKDCLHGNSAASQMRQDMAFLGHERDKMRAERDEARRKLESVASRLKDVIGQRDEAQASLKLVATPMTGVWLWQGHDDHMESLTCPVVMSAERLRILLNPLPGWDIIYQPIAGMNISEACRRVLEHVKASNQACYFQFNETRVFTTLNDTEKSLEDRWHAAFAKAQAKVRSSIEAACCGNCGRFKRDDRACGDGQPGYICNARMAPCTYYEKKP